MSLSRRVPEEIWTEKSSILQNVLFFHRQFNLRMNGPRKEMERNLSSLVRWFTNVYEVYYDWCRSTKLANRIRMSINVGQCLVNFEIPRTL